MTLSDVERFQRHWKTFPPLRVIVARVAASLGVTLVEDERTKIKPMTTEEAKRFWQATQGRIPGVGQMGQ